MRYVSITKYNPNYRIDGIYSREEWTSIYDIGNIYNGKEFTISEYESIENKYVSAVFVIFDFLKVEKIQLVNFSKNNLDDKIPLSFKSDLIDAHEISENGISPLSPNIEQVGKLIKLRLRENLSFDICLGDGSNRIEFG